MSGLAGMLYADPSSLLFRPHCIRQIPCSPPLTLFASCSTMLREGKAYMDDTPREAMQEERMKMVNSKHR